MAKATHNQPARAASPELLRPSLDRRTCIAWAIAGVVGSAPLSAPAQPAFGFDELMATLAQRGAGEARFVEERVVAGLNQPLTIIGTLSFAAPDKLMRRTLNPRPESFEVEGNQLTVQIGQRVRRTALDSVPQLAAMIEALRGTLTGNGAALKRYFAPAVQGQPAHWTLTLVPTDQRLLAVVRELRIDGIHGDVRRVDMQLADGDRSVTRIDPLPQAPAPR